LSQKCYKTVETFQRKFFFVLKLSQSSAVSFTANFLQSRVISTDVGVRLAKLYEALQVKNLEEFNQKLEELSENSSEKGKINF